MAPKKHSWSKSDGKALLLADIRAKRVTHAMDWDAVFQTRPKFCVGVTPVEALRLFQGRLTRAFKAVAVKDERVAHELALMQQDHIAHPRPALDHHGNPQWEGSQLQKLLKKDIAEGKHLTMSTTQLYNFRPEYQSMHKPLFLGKIEQEVKLVKFKKQYRNRFGY